MTTVKLHGILATEFGKVFKMQIDNPKNVLEAIDCNRSGFIRRVIELQKDGFCYDIIINKNKIVDGNQMNSLKNPETIDLVPAIVGSGIGMAVSAIVSAIGLTGLPALIAKVIIFAAIAYALTPKPEFDQLEIEADASKTSLVFSNTVNTASQGSLVPIGYGRLKVGSQVVQASVKSYPQSQTTEQTFLRNSPLGDNALITNRAPNANTQ
jgi:predicted phage tail protein|tara:strand:+ start:4573 stop:5202 length:630 start_codon:yes stop_codon:yes gene_type:complete